MAEAASRDNLEIVRTLLDAGADPNDGSLHKAALNAQVEVVQLLLEHGARLDTEINSVAWPPSDGWKLNPDVNRIRKPRGDALCFAMFRPASRGRLSQDEKDNYIILIQLLLSAYEAEGVQVRREVLRAALDTDNLIGLEQLLNFEFKLAQRDFDHGQRRSPTLRVMRHGNFDHQDNKLCLKHVKLSYIYSEAGSTPRACTFTAYQYACMMHCDDSLLEFIDSNGKRNIHDKSMKKVIEGTKLFTT